MHGFPSIRLWLLSVLLFLPFATRAYGLQVEDDFDRDWSAPEAGTCKGGHGTFVRRIAGRGCADRGAFTWAGGVALEHGAPSCARAEGCDGDSVAVHRFAEHEATGDPIGLANRGVLEILTTRERQSGERGRLQVDLHVPEDVPVTGAGEHYLIMHNLVLTEADCPRDCPGVADTATAVGAGPQRYRWYGVIGGAFGEPADRDSPIAGGSVGFAVEVANAVDEPGGRPNDLVDVSFLPYSVEGEGKVFPSGWYRIVIERDAETYGYSVRRWDGERFTPIEPDDAGSGGTHERRFPARLLSKPLGRPLPPGYVGLGVAWFGGAARQGAHVDWDDLRVDW